MKVKGFLNAQQRFQKSAAVRSTLIKDYFDRETADFSRGENNWYLQSRDEWGKIIGHVTMMRNGYTTWEDLGTEKLRTCFKGVVDKNNALFEFEFFFKNP